MKILFKKKEKVATAKDMLDERIKALTDEQALHEPGSDEWKAIDNSIKTLTESHARLDAEKKKVDPNVVIESAASLAGIGLLGCIDKVMIIGKHVGSFAEKVILKGFKRH